MINASAIGWIEKFFIEQNQLLLSIIIDQDLFYKKVRDTGFIYGHIVKFDTPVEIETKGWLEDEISKVALLNTLFGIHKLTKPDTTPENFIKKVVDFYNEIHPQGFNFLKKVLPDNSISLDLEKIIDERVQTNIDLISKNFSHIITNALLFLDVLAFHQYLIHGEISDQYLKKVEETILNIISLALKAKINRSKYDELFIKLFEASVRYSKFSDVSIENFEELNLDFLTNDLEKYYLIDMAGMALWSDGKIEKSESDFLYRLASAMQVSEVFVSESIKQTNDFIAEHKNEIAYFNYSNPVKHFYLQTTESVEVLISRNKKRLLKEITQSKELMILLALSTTRDLDHQEKKKVKKQLLDICKTIPSLAIFLLPGGSLLLPILIKFIPKLLPSSFNENLDLD